MKQNSAAAFVRIKSRLINIVNIVSIVWVESLGRLNITFLMGEKITLNQQDEIDLFYKQIEPFEILPPKPNDPEPVPVIDQGTTSDASDSGDSGETGEDDSGDEPGETDGEETDDGPSELELAGVPADLAALLHAGGIDTVEAALTHPDLSQIDGIGTGRRDKILKILNT